MTTLQEQQQKGRELKCVNGAMYFGSVEDDSCNCKTRCQNEQTYEHALEELDQHTADTWKASREQTLKEVREVVVKEHYELEEWFAHHEGMNPVVYEAHQQSMRTRNTITKKLQDIGHVKET